MHSEFNVQPLPYKQRQRTFGLLVTLFLISLPFLYLYATGYRFDIGSARNIVSTGGLYVAAERTGAEIFIDGELVRETRVFRQAFYAQSLDPGTHRVHVQKDGHHTWVKELPVSAHLVTEAQSFNLPIVPQVRVITPWVSATGTAVVRAPILFASTTNEILATTTMATSTFSRNVEYDTLLRFFATVTPTTTPSAAAQVARRIESLLETATTTSTSTPGEAATSTKEASGVRLYRDGEDVYAAWTGAFEQMPYYYCAEEFPPYSTSTASTTDRLPRTEATVVRADEDTQSLEPSEAFMHPVQTVSPDVVCDPKIRIDRKWQILGAFDFLPGTTDFVIIGLEDGIYVAEVDDRSWQNVQPVMMGVGLDFRVENGAVYVFDGTFIYQAVLEY